MSGVISSVLFDPDGLRANHRKLLSSRPGADDKGHAEHIAMKAPEYVARRLYSNRINDNSRLETNHAIFQADEIFGGDTVAKRLNSYLEKKSLQCDNVAGCTRTHTLHDPLAAFLVFVAHDFHILVVLLG